MNDSNLALLSLSVLDGPQGVCEMRNSQTGKDHYNVAIGLYKQRDYLGAVSSLDKAISCGYRDILVYDTKTLALSKLTGDDEVVWRDQAIEVIKHMCDKWGKDDWRPWYRKAEYLRSRAFYTAALPAIEKALALVNDPKKREMIVSKQTQIRGERETARIAEDRRAARGTAEDKKKLADKRRQEARSTQDFTHLLSDDILLTITDHLLLDNPSIGCRLAGISTRWRDVLYSQPNIWSTLVIGDKRPIHKAKTFIERSKGNLKKLKLLRSPKPEHETELASILVDHVGGVESVEFVGRPEHLIRHLRGRWTSLQRLVELPTPQLADALRRRPGAGLLPESSCHGPDRGHSLQSSSLRYLHIDFYGISFSTQNQVDEVYDVEASYSSTAMPTTRAADPVQTPRYLSNLRHLCVRNSYVVHYSEPLEAIHDTAPQLEVIVVEKSAWCRLERPRSLAPNETDTEPTFANLISYTESPAPQALRFGRFSAPNLVHLELSDGTGQESVMSQLRAPGLKDALSGLQSLDVSGNVLADRDTDWLELLAVLTNLRFLNISFTALGDDFLKTLTWTDDKVGATQDRTANLLPNLEAISIAGLPITSIPLREFVVSRLPTPRQIEAAPSQSQSSRRSAFLPSSSVASTQTRSTPTQTQQTGSSASSGQTESSKGNTRPMTRKSHLKWLCLDHVETVDTLLSKYLKTKMPFVSHVLSDKRDKDRYKAKGLYSWKLDRFYSCSEAGDNICTVERVLGTNDQYRVVHKCARRDIAWDDEEPEADNVWDSQFDPTQTQSSASAVEVQTQKESKKTEALKGWVKMEKMTAGSSQAGASGSSGSNQHGVKRSLSSASDTSTPGIKTRKGKSKMKISVGADGSLTGF